MTAGHMGPALQALSVTFGDSSPRGRAKRDGWKKAGGWDAIPPLGVFAQLGVCSADDVAVIIHDDLLAIGKGKLVQAGTNSVRRSAADLRLVTIQIRNGFLQFRRNEIATHLSCSPFLSP